MSAQESSSCEGPLTLSDCSLALKQMSKGKSPGSDGLTTDFYKAFWHLIGPLVIDSLNFAFLTGSLSPEQRRAIITLIPKPNKDRSFLKNWRPIHLLNIDYKIAAKALANRLKQVLPTLISHSQIVKQVSSKVVSLGKTLG